MDTQIGIEALVVPQIRINTIHQNLYGWFLLAQIILQLTYPTLQVI
ncbi:MAG: hypothetical protein JOZ48_04930 [Acidobacteriaceae bacterium]|nr:hypothetical protein [Acidobacteriaceae bacterium]